MPGGLTPAQFAENPYQSLRNHDYMKGHRTDGSVKYSYKKMTMPLSFWPITLTPSVMQEWNVVDQNCTKRRHVIIK